MAAAGALLLVGASCQRTPDDAPAVARAPAPRTCSIPAVASTLLTLFRGPAGGACGDPAALVEYQCAAGKMPILVSDITTAPADYLGGPLAVPAAAPADSAVLGTTDGGTSVWRSGSDPNALYVRDAGGAVTRWPRPLTYTTSYGAPVIGFVRPHVFFLGDSVMLGAQAAITAAMVPWDITFDAMVSRSTLAGLEVIRARRAEIQDMVVIQLGTNDGGNAELFRSRMTAIQEELRGVPLVVWLTIREARPYYATDNQVIREVAAAYPNTIVADWNAASTPDGVGADGLHLFPSGADQMAKLAHDTVVAWYWGKLDRGDDSCRAGVTAAVAAVSRVSVGRDGF